MLARALSGDAGHNGPDHHHHKAHEAHSGKQHPKRRERGFVAPTGESDGESEQDPGSDVVEGGGGHGGFADVSGKEFELGKDAGENREGGDREGYTHEHEMLEVGVEVEDVLEEEGDGESEEEGKEHSGEGDGEGSLAGAAEAVEVEFKPHQEQEEQEPNAGYGFKDGSAPTREYHVHEMLAATKSRRSKQYPSL